MADLQQADVWPRQWRDSHITLQQGMGHWGVRIAGTGSMLPGEPITNDELLQRHSLDTSSSWIEAHTGIVARHHAPPEMATSDLAAAAGRMAIEAAGLVPSDLGRIILGTSTGDWTSPAAANRVQHLLGASCPAVDVQSACCSWMFALEQGARLVATGVPNVLVVGADVKSRFVQLDDRRLMPVFGDGAGAVVLAPCEGDDGLLQLELYTDGAMVECLVTPAGGSALPASAETVEKSLHSTRLTIDGQLVKAHAAWMLSRVAQQVLEQAAVAIDEIDWFVPHQANRAIMRALAAELGVPEEKMVSVIHMTGNTVSATVPIAFDCAQRDGRFQPGDLVLIATGGAGYSAGAALYRIPR